MESDLQFSPHSFLSSTGYSGQGTLQKPDCHTLLLAEMISLTEINDMEKKILNELDIFFKNKT